MAAPNRATLPTRPLYNERPRQMWCAAGRHYVIRDPRLGSLNNKLACSSHCARRLAIYREPDALQRSGSKSPFLASTLTPGEFSSST